MTLRIFVALHLAVLVFGALALVWLGTGPDDAVAEALVAGAFATVGEASECGSALTWAEKSDALARTSSRQKASQGFQLALRSLLARAALVFSVAFMARACRTSPLGRGDLERLAGLRIAALRAAPRHPESPEAEDQTSSPLRRIGDRLKDRIDHFARRMFREVMLLGELSTDRSCS